PAGCLSWYEAEAYCRWSGKRMPTESEWEFAAASAPLPLREGAGGGIADFPWGDEPASPEKASFGLNSWGAKPASEFAPNANGIRGMAGGLWEWTSSQFLPYPGFEAFPYDGYSKDHMKGEHRVCRGGSFATAAPILRCSFRNWYVPAYRQGFL